MAGISRRLTERARQLGAKNLTTKAIEAEFSRAGELAAEVVRRVLEGQIKQVQRDSESGALEGYTAGKFALPKGTQVKLKQSGITLDLRKTNWLVFVNPSRQHASRGLNVFDILSSGRKFLPKKAPSQGAYPLWGVTESGLDRVTEPGELKFTIARPVVSLTPIRPEPRFIVRALGRPFFTQGPIKAVDPKNLYDRALASAKDRLSIAGLSRSFEVIFVPDGLREAL